MEDKYFQCCVTKTKYVEDLFGFYGFFLYYLLFGHLSVFLCELASQRHCPHLFVLPLIQGPSSL